MPTEGLTSPVFPSVGFASRETSIFFGGTLSVASWTDRGVGVGEGLANTIFFGVDFGEALAFGVGFDFGFDEGVGDAVDFGRGVAVGAGAGVAVGVGVKAGNWMSLLAAVNTGSSSSGSGVVSGGC